MCKIGKFLDEANPAFDVYDSEEHGKLKKISIFLQKNPWSGLKTSRLKRKPKIKKAISRILMRNSRKKVKRKLP